MEDQEVIDHIEGLVRQEHELWDRSESDQLEPEEQEQLDRIQVGLDRYWDALRQRRARRRAGLDPDDADLRDEEVVEHYKQ